MKYIHACNFIQGRTFENLHHKDFVYPSLSTSTFKTYKNSITEEDVKIR